MAKPWCACCYDKHVEKYGELCPGCQARIDRGELVKMDKGCPKCKLHWSGYYDPKQEGLKFHTEFDCARVRTNTIDPNQPRAGSVELRCSKCGKRGYFTKNIGGIGERHIFYDGAGRECYCPASYLEPVKEHAENIQFNGEPAIIWDYVGKITKFVKCVFHSEASRVAEAFGGESGWEYENCTWL